MNIVNSGSFYKIYDEGMQTFKTLPPKVFNVGFSKMQGFFLTVRSDIKVEEEKIYGNYVQKINKVLNGYKAVDRNFGVILSGPKGVGKTLFTKLLSIIASTSNYPVIIVSEYIPGISNFISSIDQDVVVLFDEFEKTFTENDEKTGTSPQNEMLSLFDGLDSGHKLFIITCNEVHKLSDYMLNRPGRFHYHFTLDVPTGEEIREYLEDKLAPPYHGNIDKIISFSAIGKITYDCLRAIAFELNQGYSLEETLNDLNLVRDKNVYFDITIEFMDGTTYKEFYLPIDVTSATPFGRWFTLVGPKMDEPAVYVSFMPCNMKVDPNRPDRMYIDKSDIVDIHYDAYDIPDDNDGQKKAIIANRIADGVKNIYLTKAVKAGYKYIL